MDRLPAPRMPVWLERMLPFERCRIDLGEHRMHVMESGRGRPVLMLHGNPTWGFLYRRVAEALTGEPFRLVMPDLIGLGFSDKPREPSIHTLDNHARWVGRLVESLELDDLIFVGQDWGGPIGLRLFADRPSLVAGLVLLNTVVSPPKPGFQPTAFHRFSRMPLASDVAYRWLGFPQSMLFLAQGNKRSIRGKVARAYRYPIRRRADRIAPLALARVVPDSLDHPSIPGLTRCKAFIDGYSGPCAIVWGDRDPILGGVRSWVEKLLPQASVTRTQAGHFLQEEVPEEIGDAIRVVGRAIDA